jgi:hypothetical protein
MSIVEQPHRTTAAPRDVARPAPATGPVSVAKQQPAVPRPADTSPPRAGSLSSNPVAVAHARGATSAAEGHWMSGVLVWTVLIPTLVVLVSNPLGWVILFMLVLAGATLTAFGAIF